MPRYALRISFPTEQDARDQFGAFPSSDAPYIQRISRKRDGNTWVIMADLQEQRDLDAFLVMCRSHPRVNEIKLITEAEWLDAPSHFNMNLQPNSALVTDACAAALLRRASYSAAQRGR